MISLRHVMPHRLKIFGSLDQFGFSESIRESQESGNSPDINVVALLNLLDW